APVARRKADAARGTRPSIQDVGTGDARARVRQPQRPSAQRRGAAARMAVWSTRIQQLPGRVLLDEMLQCKNRQEDAQGFL
ncbi:unnamed protein product, partial [Urochloa humidicola]